MDTDTGPEKESLTFSLPSKISPDKLELVTQIKQAAESLLYAWKIYPIQLPPSTITHEATEHVINANQLFIAPSFDELEEVARLNPQLTKEHLNSIKKRGEFDVPSKHFPGQFHRWRLGLFFGKGSERAMEALRCNCALALRLLIVTAKGRLASRFFSVKVACRNILLGLWQLLDILFGMPKTEKLDVSSRLLMEHRRHLVAELNIRKDDRKAYDELQTRLANKLYGTDLDLEGQERAYDDDAAKEKVKVPHVFTLPRGMLIDLRLYNKDCMRAKPILQAILERESKGWYIRFKDELILKFQTEGPSLTIKQLSEKVEAGVRDEYFRRVFEAVENDLELDNIQHKIGSLLVQQAKAHFIIANANEASRQKYSQQLEQRTQELKKSYPIRCKIQPWLRKQLDEFKREFVAKNRWSAHERSISECQRQNLHQMVYFLQRDLLFWRDREPALRKEFPSIKLPRRTYAFSARIWFPRNWVVTKTWTERGTQRAEVVPTTIHDELAPNSSAGYSGRKCYTVCKNTIRTSDTQYVGWRCVNCVLRTWAWLFNCMFYLGFTVPFCSSVGIRALLGCHVFYPKYCISNVNGQLYRSPASKTHTMTTKLNRLWRNVRHSREKFESKPDTGFLNKDMARPMHKFWNYVLKGAIGSLLFVLIYPLVCVIICLICFVLCLTACIWVPLGSLFAYLGSVLIYDFDHSTHKGWRILYFFEAIFYRILLMGFVHMLVAVLTAFIVVPAASLAVLVFGVVRWLMRRTWDTFIFHVVVKRRGRVPASDTFVARRLSGPGMASNYFYQIRQEQVYAAVQLHMEEEALDVWAEREKASIRQPSREFEQFINECFGPFSAQPAPTIGQLSVITRRQADIEEKLSAAVTRRRKLLKAPIAYHLRDKIKISRRDLTTILTRTATMVEKFYPDNIFAVMSAERTLQTWEKRNLEVNDWKGLAAYILTQIFSPQFLVPLEDTDTCFQLEVDELTLGAFMKRLITVDFPDDLGSVSTIHTPRESLEVEKPQIDVFAFFPTYGTTSDFPYSTEPAKPRRPWKTRREGMDWHDSLYVPLPIMHPIYICVLIYERENDQNTLRLDTLQSGNYRYLMEGWESCLIAFADGSTLADTSVLSQEASVISTGDDMAAPGMPLSPPPPASDEVGERPASAHLSIPEIRVQLEGDQEPGGEGSRESSPARVIYSEGERSNSCVVSVSDDEESVQMTSDFRLSSHTHADV